MKDIFCRMMHLICVIFLSFVGTSYSAELKCGFPGTPLYGTVAPHEAAYKEGVTVMYTCRVGYILIGSSISRCKGDGTWSEEVPVCDDSMTTLVSASSTPTVPGHSAELAIDKNKETCTYLQAKPTKWWRIDLGDNKEYKVLSVAITMKNTDKHVKFSVFVIQIQNQIASYKRCASFSGKFGTPTMVLLCAEGKGIDGHRVHIEDYNKSDKEFFEICEVEIQVKKDDGYDCGAPSRSLYLELKTLSDDEVEYECLRGYKLSGRAKRTCEEESGQWSGEPPICIPIVCDDLEPFENGVYQIQPFNDDPVLEGSEVIYQCNSHYKLIGDSTRTCLSKGVWSGRPPKCRVITCPAEIPYDVGGKWRYQNVRVGSLATLRCTNEKYEGDNNKIVCTEDGVWSEPEARCLIPIALAKKESNPRIVNQGGIIFGMVLAAIMIVVVLVGVYLYDQRRRNNKPELPSRFQDPPLPPPRPPPRAKGNAFKSAFKGFLNRDNLDSDRPDKSSWKTQSLPSSQSPTDESESKLNSKKALSYNESLSGGEDEDSPAVVEVEVLPPHRPGRKGVITPVPEEPENIAVDDVIIEMDEADSNKDSSAKDNKNTSDYAAVDYEKKRQSRLLKEQDSLESSSTAPGSPLPLDESDKKEFSRSSTPAKDLEESEEEDEDEEEESEESQHTDSQQKREAEEQERKAKEEEERKAKEEEERIAKEEEERKAKEEEERKAKEEEEKKKKEEASSRRRRVRDEPPTPAVEDKPVLRRLRKFQ